jgi:hypothetical protein
MLNLQQVADELGTRLIKIFQADKNGRRPCHGDEERFAADPQWNELLLFYEYFHGETGRGCGASHQTGWTALVSRIIFGRGRKLEREKRVAAGPKPATAGAK